MNRRGGIRGWRGVRGAGLLLVLWVSGVQAQWTTQSIQLRAGWNAVFLEVQPAQDDCDAAFAGLPVESVWAWNRRVSTVQFIQDPGTLVLGQPDWLTYVPPGDPAYGARDLHALEGGRAYLIKLRSGASTVMWDVVGSPVHRAIEWLPDSLSFVGFPLGPTGQPTFQSFFSGSPAHAGQRMYRLSAAGQWEAIANPATAVLRWGEAYWVYCRGASSFAGPVRLGMGQREGLLYGRLLTEQTLRIRNDASSPRTFSVQVVTSMAPPDGSYPVLAGPVPLSYYRVDAANRQFGWVPFSGPLNRLNVQPGEEWVLRLEVNRARMESFNPPAGHNGVLYQGLLQVSSEFGVRQWVAVSAEGLRALPVVGLARQLEFEPEPHAGLWVGAAVVNRVSQPSKLSSPDSPLPVGSPLQFRLLVHVDTEGNVRLLQKVLQMFRPGTLKPDPEDPGRSVIDEPGREVLVTDDALTSAFSGVTLRDGRSVARRLSSSAFSFREPVLLSGEGRFGAGAFAGDLEVGYDDPLNPYKHRYHPEHDNLDDRFEVLMGEGAEAFSIGRRIELEFTPDDPESLTLAGWGDTQLGGHYRETITGLHHRPILVSGTFRLTRASRVGVLNDGVP
jgi:hypothetical protein